MATGNGSVGRGDNGHPSPGMRPEEAAEDAPHWRRGLEKGFMLGLVLALLSAGVFGEKAIVFHLNDPVCFALRFSDSVCSWLVRPVLMILELALSWALVGWMVERARGDGYPYRRKGLHLGLALGAVMGILPEYVTAFVVLAFMVVDTLLLAPFICLSCATGAFCMTHGGEAIVLYAAPFLLPVGGSLYGACIGWAYGNVRG